MRTAAPAPPAAAARGSRRPASPHAARQRERILDAAELCFIRSGFHGASMADVATAAGMSAGLIYRYFDSKAAIVKAIIQRHIESDECKTAGLDTPAEVTREILALVERWQQGRDPKLNPVLTLELSAEASRDAQIAQVVRRSDRLVAERITQAVRRFAGRDGVRLSAAAARSRAVLLHCLIEGLAMRVVRDPALRRATLQPALEQIIAALMG